MSAWESKCLKEGDKGRGQQVVDAVTSQTTGCESTAASSRCWSNNLFNSNPLPWLWPGNEEQFLSRTLVDISSAGWKPLHVFSSQRIIFFSPTFYSLCSAEAWAALIQLLGRLLERCSGAPTQWKWGYPPCLWKSHSGRQNHIGRAVSEVMARTELFFNEEQFPTLLILPTLSKMSGMLKINDNPCERETDTKEHSFHHTQFSFLPLSIADSVLCLGNHQNFSSLFSSNFRKVLFYKTWRERGDLVDTVSCIQNKAEPWAVS